MKEYDKKSELIDDKKQIFNSKNIEELISNFDQKNLNYKKRKNRLKEGEIYSINRSIVVPLKGQMYPYTHDFSPTAGYIPVENTSGRESVLIQRGAPVMILKTKSKNKVDVKLLGKYALNFTFETEIKNIDTSPADSTLKVRSQFFGNLLDAALKKNNYYITLQVLSLILHSKNRSIPFEGKNWVKRDVTKYLIREGKLNGAPHIKRNPEYFQLGHFAFIGKKNVADLKYTEESEGGLLVIEYLSRITKENANGFKENIWTIKKTGFRFSDIFEIAKRPTQKPKSTKRGYTGIVEGVVDVLELATNTYLFFLSGEALVTEVVGTPATLGASASLIPATTIAFFVTGDNMITKVGVIYRKLTNDYEDGDKTNDPYIRQGLRELSKVATGSESIGKNVYDYGTLAVGVVKINQGVQASKAALMSSFPKKAVKPATGAMTGSYLKLKQLINMASKD
ncbi:hypothetical protein [Aquimarina longa]|uniref:hypothetical protein n=1 Tax=Aquimarina longa TaxID=1080221 RepID=UPI0007833D79|nr:hypothetical protein [Aquimarina longa]